MNPYTQTWLGIIPEAKAPKTSANHRQKRYKLMYGSQTIVNNVAYAVCVAKKKELSKQSNYKYQTFKIIPA